VNWVDQSIREAFADQKASEFLYWLEGRRQILICRFRMAYDQELILEDLWHREIMEGTWHTDTLSRLCLVTLIRERVEHALNLIDFGGDYGKQDFIFLRRMIGQWINKNLKCARYSARR
jgi:hypothetical protein